MLRIFSVVLLATLAASFAQSQTVVTIGTATAGNNFPFNASTGMRYQEIYSAAEIGLAAGGTLTEIQVAKTTGTIATYNNFRLRLGHTNVGITSPTVTYDTNYQGSLTVGLGDPNVPGTAPVNLLPTSIVVGAQEYVRFPFTTNFAYNGTSNLLVDWSYDTLTGTGWQTSGTGRSRVYLLGGNAQSVTAAGTGDGGNWQVRLIFNTGPAPELDISRGATAIADGGTDTATGFTAGTAGTLTYTLANTGAGSLTLTNPATLAAQTNCTVSIATAPTTPVAAAGSTSTVLSVTPTAAGAFSFTYSIGNNDGNENPYNWTVSGTAAAAAAPELDVTRGATAIADGGTDNVGAAFMAGSASALIYTFTNSGTASLTITNPATLGAQTNCTVTITTVPTTPVAAAGTTTTELSVTPTGAGAFSFTYSIANSDANENPYNWTVSGTATAPAPEMDLSRGATAVADGSTDTATGGASGTALVLSYTITNSGSANLTLNIPVAAPGTLTNCIASISAQPTTPIAAAGTSVMVVSVTPTAAGAFSCTLTIGNNDANENPYDWTISGTATGPQPEMDVLRIAASVADGSNDTLGSVLFGQALTVTYTIANTGTAGLNLTGAPTLVVATAGTNVTSATVTTQPAASVAIAASTSFVVTYNVTAAGAFNFTLSIANNDSNENPYNWTVDGTGTAMPEINVTRAATPVADGGTNSVGNVTAGQSQTLTFTIANQGNVALTITTPVTIAGLVNCTATVVTQPGVSVAAAGTTSLVISVTPTAVGAFSFTVSFANNDSDENPYNWTVSGTGTTLGGGVAGGGGGGGGCALTSSGTGGWLVILASLMLAGFAVARRRA